jgi:hypothetical protein
MTARVLIVFVLTLSVNARASQNSLRSPVPDEPVYVVTPNASSEGYGPASAKFADLLMVQIFPSIPAPSGDGSRIDGTRYYEKGKLVALFVDGERRGEVRIETVKEYNCNSAAALVTPTLAAVSKKIVGLATNAAGIQSRRGNLRDATASERRTATDVSTFGNGADVGEGDAFVCGEVSALKS